jgi:glycerol-3-phosphate dehydrogenase
MINLIGIESPGLTASMPIAKYVEKMLDAELKFNKKTSYNPIYKRITKFSNSEEAIKNKLIIENSDWGEIICRCEGITLAEIKNALNNPLGVRTLTGIKNRVRAMMGRCQGGYCISHIISILINDFGYQPQDVAFRHIGDQPFVGYIK